MRWLTPPYRLAGLALAVSIVYWSAIFPAPTMPRWWVLALGLPILGTVLPTKGSVLVAALGTLGLLYALTASLVGGDLINSALPLYFLVILALAALSGNAVDDLDPALLAFALGICVSSIVCLLQLLDLSPLPKIALTTGLFFNSEVVAETAAPILVWALLRYRFVLAGVLAFPVIVCQSRIAVAVTVGGLFWAWRPKARWIKPALACALVAGVLIALLGLGDLKINSAEHRLTLWGAAFQSIVPLGQGLGWWASAHPFGFEEFVHSDALQFLVELGLGGAFFIAVPVVILFNGIEDRAQGACFVALCLEGLVSFPLHLPATGFLLAILCGHLARRRDPVRVAQLLGGIARGLGLQRQIPYGSSVAGYRAEVGRNLRGRPAYPHDPRTDSHRRAQSLGGAV